MHSGRYWATTAVAPFSSPSMGMGARLRDKRYQCALSPWERARVRVVPNAAPRVGFPHPAPEGEGVCNLAPMPAISYQPAAANPQ